MTADLADHDRALLDAVSALGGAIFKHTGDGVMAVFDDPLAAVAAASAMQQAISSTEWRTPDGIAVRVAVHCGTVHERDGDLFGTAVNRAARLLSICPPGSVLVSAASAALITDRGLTSVRRRRLGTVHLRGFAEPEAVHGLVANHLPLPERLDTDESRAVGQLPVIEETLVGRSDELAISWDAVQTHSLVSLVGVGGMAKTRLALEVAAGLVHDFPGGAWWCDPTSATTADSVADRKIAKVAPGHRLPSRQVVVVPEREERHVYRIGDERDDRNAQRPRVEHFGASKISDFEDDVTECSNQHAVLPSW